jgi:hypothetical protein
VEGSEWSSASALVLPTSSKTQGHASAMTDAQITHERHVPDARRPVRHLAEQVAGDEVVDVGHVFGLVTGCFREWAKKQNWSPHEALQI